ELGQLLHALAPGDPLAKLVGKRRAVQPARAPARLEPEQRLADPTDVVRSDDDAGPGLPDQVRGRAGRRHRREDRTLGGEVLEDLPRQYRGAAVAGLGEQEQERLGIALVCEGKMPWTKGQQFQPVAEIERLRPLAVARRQLADEARRDVLEPGFLD